MALFRTVGLPDTVTLIEGRRVTLRAPTAGDYAAWTALREESRSFLTPWEPIWPADDLTRSAFRRRLRRYAEDLRSDQAYAFFVFRAEDNMLIGGLTLANIRRGVAQAGSIGYWMGAPYASRGYMTDAVRTLIPFAFGALRLHRLEAACIPTNTPSIRLLERLGFAREGLAREYLCINGVWEDHLLYALLASDVAR
ncbi:MAG: [ribosomal protein S5]-alanine N-acetyltransferase [Variibacter sp.]|jgi:ribosomal-protein-alanine N-acetyltransferase|nr:[ribosomal protein S5]-alanine N-acetyltransferase [Variibacter sp.]